MRGSKLYCILRQYQGEGDDNWVTEATFTQELDLEKQLQWGSRYLDIRVGYCKFRVKKCNV